jgi:hypothetical protein
MARLDTARIRRVLDLVKDPFAIFLRDVGAFAQEVGGQSVAATLGELAERQRQRVIYFQPPQRVLTSSPHFLQRCS